MPTDAKTPWLPQHLRSCAHKQPSPTSELLPSGGLEAGRVDEVLLVTVMLAALLECLLPAGILLLRLPNWCFLRQRRLFCSRSLLRSARARLG